MKLKDILDHKAKRAFDAWMNGKPTTKFGEKKN